MFQLVIEWTEYVAYPPCRKRGDARCGDVDGGTSKGKRNIFAVMW